MYVVWEEIWDVHHGLEGDRGYTPELDLGGDRGWTPVITKLAGVTRVQVPKSYCVCIT